MICVFEETFYYDFLLKIRPIFLQALIQQHAKATCLSFPTTRTNTKDKSQTVEAKDEDRFDFSLTFFTSEKLFFVAFLLLLTKVMNIICYIVLISVAFFFFSLIKSTFKLFSWQITNTFPLYIISRPFSLTIFFCFILFRLV